MRKPSTTPGSDSRSNPPGQGHQARPAERERQGGPQEIARCKKLVGGSPLSSKAQVAEDEPTEPLGHGSIPTSNPGEKKGGADPVLECLLAGDGAADIPQRMLSSRETASILNMSQSWLNKQRVSGGEDTIPFHKLGRRVQYHPRDVQAALLKSRRRSTSQSDDRSFRQSNEASSRKIKNKRKDVAGRPKRQLTSKPV